MGDSAQASAGAGYGSAALTAAGGITQAYGAYQAGKYNRKVASFNEAQANIEAEQAIQSGEFAANRVATHGAQVVAADRAAQGSSGTVVGAGSNAQVIASNQAMSAADELMIKLNARRQAYGYRVRGVAAKSEGVMAEKAGNQQALATLLNTGATEWRDYDRMHGGLKFAGGESPVY